MTNKHILKLTQISKIKRYDQWVGHKLKKALDSSYWKGTKSLQALLIVKVGRTTSRKVRWDKSLLKNRLLERDTRHLVRTRLTDYQLKLIACWCNFKWVFLMSSIQCIWLISYLILINLKLLAWVHVQVVFSLFQGQVWWWNPPLILIGDVPFY